MTVATILVVDKDARARAQVAQELRQLGHVVSESSGAKSALEVLQETRPDLVVVDMHLPELVTLVEQVGERLDGRGEATGGEVIVAGQISADTASHRVAIDGEYIALAPREYRLLIFLLRNQNRVFSRKQLLAHVWDREQSVGPRTVDVHVRRLRGILEPHDIDGYLQTVRGTGYRFSTDV